ncbi:hypothetical protein V5E97_28735 [Singulisphaera sp. Ch08]|uniref:Uncharacterized protein n=1 Tax=Singulisphaera sp. Ch08 TaxID=3120278 RepID=A0AAU7CAU4_9BACT
MCHRMKLILFSLAFATTGMLIIPRPIAGQGILHRNRKVIDKSHQIVTVKQLAALIDDLDEELFEEGMIGMKAPDVWGQNRMTKYRAEYEKEMADQVNKFTVTLNAAIRRADTAVLTSATSIGAAIQPRAAAGRRGGAASSATAAPSTTVVVPAAPGGTAQPLLDSISALLNRNATNLPQLPTALLPTDAIELEPKIGLDERDDYLKHLQELRRTNSGDDLTDAPGYGLYLIRMPISLLPGPEVRKGHGATVTVEAKHMLSPDLLPTTFRDITIMDTAYQIHPILLKLIHNIPISDPNTMTVAAAPTTQLHSKNSGLQSPDDRSFVDNGASGGNSNGIMSTIPFSESPDIYGVDEQAVLLDAINKELADGYRHDPSILSWLINGLGHAHRYMREQARNGMLTDMFSTARFQQLDNLVQQRNYVALAEWRRQFIDELVIRRNGWNYTPGMKYDIKQYKRATDVFIYALMVQSVLVDRQLKHDIDVISQQKGCACEDLNNLTFYDLLPSPEAREAFNTYVRCKWPIHVFAIDPAVEQQNHLDLFSARSEFQAALAVGIASGNLNFDQATKFARRLETDLETIGLNRTAIGYGAGESTFGWQFYPRIQTPPTPGNVRRIAGLIAGTSYNQSYIAKNRFIEPGPRECVALVVAPNFVPSIHFTSFGNWFEYVGKHANQKFDTADVLEFSRKLQTAKNALNQVCDSGDYRPGEIARLSDRLAQLEAKLPSQDYRVPLPYEGDLLGSEVFNSSGTRLFPRLLSWFGEPAQVGKPSTIFMLGTSFSVHETQVIAGGVPAADMKLISRNVMEITIKADARPIQTRDGRLIFDVHIATPNGISNHLFVEANPPPPTTPAPAFGYAIKTSELSISYGVTNRVEGVPAQPGVAGVIDSTPDQIVLSWLEPVGLAPDKVKIEFKFPNLSPIEIVDLKPNAKGQIVIANATLDQLTNDILIRLHHTAVTFDPIRNPTPLKPITTTSIVVTPTTGTHAERGVAASGSLTVSFTPLALPTKPVVVVPSGTPQIAPSADRDSKTTDSPQTEPSTPDDTVPPPVQDAPPQAIPPSTLYLPNSSTGASSASRGLLETLTRTSTQPGKFFVPDQPVMKPAQVGSAISRNARILSPRSSRPIMPAIPNSGSALAARVATTLRDPAIVKSSTTGQARTTGKPTRNEN